LSQQAQDPEGKNFIKALNMSAPKIAQLENVSPEFDVRPLLTENIKKVIAQKKEGKPLADLLGQLDTNQTEQEALINKQVLECLIENINKPAVLSNKFNKLATLMQIENNQAKENPMYALMSEPKENIIKRAFEDKKEITGDSQNKLFSFWKKNFYLVMSDDKRKHKKYFRKLHELKI
jgi:hypothetical protein